MRLAEPTETETTGVTGLLWLGALPWRGGGGADLPGGGRTPPGVLMVASCALWAQAGALGAMFRALWVGGAGVLGEL